MPSRRVGEAVREVVHRVDAPGVARTVVGRVPDAVEHRVAHDDVGGGHVDLRPQHVRPVRELPRAHAPEQVQVLRRRATAVRAFRAGGRERAPRRRDLLRALAVDVRLAALDELFGEPVQGLEVVGCERRGVTPGEPEPGDVALDGRDELLALLQRVGVVETQERSPPELFGHAEVQADGLRVADGQVAVRLRREPRHDGVRHAFRQILADAVAYEVVRLFRHGEGGPVESGILGIGAAGRNGTRQVSVR